MPQPDRPNFAHLPKSEEIAAQLAMAGIESVSAIELFPFSASTPVFLIKLGKPFAGRKRIVLRGEQQNGNRFLTPAERSIEKEIHVLQLLRSLGIATPEVYCDGQIFNAPGYDLEGNANDEPFRFFFMECVRGIAIDQPIRNSRGRERLKLYERVAEIYAKTHRHKGASYGFVTTPVDAGNGQQHPTLQRFLGQLLATKCHLPDQCIEAPVRDELKRFADTTLVTLETAIADSGYQAEASFVYQDGFAGNMLIDGDVITMLDVASAAYSEAPSDFTTFITTLNAVLLETDAGVQGWQHFFNSYAEQGGNLPPDEVLLPLMRLFIAEAILSYVVYCRESPSAKRQGKALPALQKARNVMIKPAETIPELISLVS